MSALLLAVIFWLTLTMEDRDGLKPWLEFGLLWGIAALNSTVLLAFLPASGLWAWYHRAKRAQAIAGRSGAGFHDSSSPASRRGRCATIKPSASSFSSAITLARNCAWATATAPTAPGCSTCIPRKMSTPCASTPPWANCAYIEMRKRQAWTISKRTTPRFALLCVKRFIYFWAGSPRTGTNLVAGQIEKLAFPGLVRA